MAIESSNTYSLNNQQALRGPEAKTQPTKAGRTYFLITPLKACLIGAIFLAVVAPAASAYGFNSRIETRLLNENRCYTDVFGTTRCIQETIYKIVNCFTHEVCDGWTFWGDQICHLRETCYDL